MENGWWASTRREEDARLYVKIRRGYEERNTGHGLGAFAVWLVATIALAMLVDAVGLSGFVTLAGSVAAAVVTTWVARSGSREA